MGSVCILFMHAKPLLRCFCVHCGGQYCLVPSWLASIQLYYQLEGCTNGHVVAGLLQLVVALPYVRVCIRLELCLAAWAENVAVGPAQYMSNFSC